MAAAPVQLLPPYFFYDMSDEEIQQWVEANPGRINDKDFHNTNSLYEVAIHRNDMPLTVWLLDEKDAEWISKIIFDSPSPEILAVFLDRSVHGFHPAERG